MKTRELQVIPKFMAGWIEGYREHYKNDFLSIGYDLHVRGIHPAVEDWIIQNQEKFIRAWFDGYEVEEEQKYYVLDSEDIPLLQKTNNHTCKTTTGLSIYEDGRDNSRFEFTEQEIKDYDERYFAFAVTVESKELF